MKPLIARLSIFFILSLLLIGGQNYFETHKNQLQHHIQQELQQIKQDEIFLRKLNGLESFVIKFPCGLESCDSFEERFLNFLKIQGAQDIKLTLLEKQVYPNAPWGIKAHLISWDVKFYISFDSSIFEKIIEIQEKFLSFKNFQHIHLESEGDKVRFLIRFDTIETT